MEENVEIDCACGCGTKLLKFDKHYRERRYVSGHNGRKFTGEASTRTAATMRWKQRRPDKVRDARRNYYRKRKLMAMELLGNKCSHCGVEYDGMNAPIFEFHHFDPSTKENGVTRMLTNQAWETTLKELEKCHLVCANCHNQHHGGKW